MTRVVNRRKWGDWVERMVAVRLGHKSVPVAGHALGGPIHQAAESAPEHPHCCRERGSCDEPCLHAEVNSTRYVDETRQDETNRLRKEDARCNI